MDPSDDSAFFNETTNFISAASKNTETISIINPPDSDGYRWVNALVPFLAIAIPFVALWLILVAVIVWRSKRHMMSQLQHRHPDPAEPRKSVTSLAGDVDSRRLSRQALLRRQSQDV